MVIMNPCGNLKFWSTKRILDEHEIFPSEEEKWSAPIITADLCYMMNEQMRAKKQRQNMMS